MPNAKLNRVRAVAEKLQAHKISDTEYRVYNVTKGTSYSVLRSVSGTWYCTCLWAQKKSSSNPDICKHLQRVVDKEIGCAECGRKDEFAGLKRPDIASPYVCAACRLG